MIIKVMKAMARTKCAVCGKNLDTSRNNSEFVNGVWVHKKCPKTNVLSEEEKKKYRQLTDEIKNVTDSQNKPLSPAQWRMITSQIQRLKEEGFDYEKQLIAFRHYFITKGNEYKGYGIMEWVINQCLLEIETENVANMEKDELKDKLKEYMEQKRKERLNIE